MEQWHRIEDDEVPDEGRVAGVVVDGRPVALTRCRGAVGALENRCPHQGGPLCQGRVAPWARSSGPGDFQLDAEASLLACPWHGWEYDLATGQSFMGPGEPGVKSYDVDVEPGAHLAGREPGPYVAETFAVHVEEDYVVIDA